MNPFNRPKNIILYISPGGENAKGGIGRMCRYLKDAFADNHPDFELRILDTYGSGRPVSMLLRFMTVAAVVAGQLVVRRSNVVHINSAAHGSAIRKLILARIGQAARLQVHFHIHGSRFDSWFLGASPIIQSFCTNTLNRCASVIVIGEYWRNFAATVMNIPYKKIALIYNGVPLHKFSRAPRAQRSDTVTVICCGALGDRKGTADLLICFAMAIQRCPQLRWSLKLAGNGDIPKYYEQARQLGIEEHVTFLGWVSSEQVWQHLSESNIFVLPSHNEGLPVAIIEAMAHGLPIVSTRVGAIPELVTPEIGILIDAGDINSLAEALMSLGSNPNLCGKLGQEAATKAQQFDIATIADELITLYISQAAQKKRD